MISWIIVRENQTKKEPIKETDHETIVSEENSSIGLSQIEQNILLEKIKVYDSYIISFDGTKSMEQLTYDDKIMFINTLSKSEKETWKLDFEMGVSLGKVEEVLAYYFGKNGSFEPVNCPCFLNDGDYLIYNETTHMYYADTDMHGHEGFTPYQVMTYYIDGYKEMEDNHIVYTIQVKKAFALPNSSSFYGSYTDATTKENLLFDLFQLYGEKAYSQQEELLKIQYEKKKGLFPVYTYRFVTATDVHEAYLWKLTK